MAGVTVESFSTPRRLTLGCAGCQSARPMWRAKSPGRQVRGLRRCRRADTGRISFAEKQGIALSEIYFLQTPKGEYLAAKNVKRGRATEHILAEILPRILHDLYWPKTMTWTGLSGARFIRPIRWIVGATRSASR